MAIGSARQNTRRYGTINTIDTVRPQIAEFQTATLHIRENNAMFRFLTAGESHGPCLTVIIEGIPANLTIQSQEIDEQLQRRQGGYGRGARMRMETDCAEILSGVRHGKTLGSPITLQIKNKDWVNWQEKMAALPTETPPEIVSQIRAGHADFTGAMKYHQHDIRNVIERSSARETAARVAVGAICRQFLAQFHITIHSHVLSVGDIGSSDSFAPRDYSAAFWERVEASPMRCGDTNIEEQMIRFIDEIRKKGDTVGGIFEVVALGVPIGLGSFSQWDLRLNSLLGHYLLSIPSAKGVEIGAGFAAARQTGSRVHDVLRHEEDRGWSHTSNNAGGIEGGISNGEPIVARAALKPIPTLAKPLPSVDFATGENIEKSRYERSDVCVVPAGAVVGEAMLAIALTEVFIEKFGGDSIEETQAHYQATQTLLRP